MYAEKRGRCDDGLCLAVAAEEADDDVVEIMFVFFAISIPRRNCFTPSLAACREGRSRLNIRGIKTQDRVGEAF